MIGKRTTCVWSPLKTTGGAPLWKTSCGFGAKTAFSYCPYCGGALVKECEPVTEAQLELPMEKKC